MPFLILIIKVVVVDFFLKCEVNIYILNVSVPFCQFSNFVVVDHVDSGAVSCPSVCLSVKSKKKIISLKGGQNLVLKSLV